MDEKIFNEILQLLLQIKLNQMNEHTDDYLQLNMNYRCQFVILSIINKTEEVSMLGILGPA